ncbi:alpha/beta hydrolase [Rhodanobacter sp. L36]|uniref:alpha/beta hydrolase n=1 Tax=Rhodanobacter sp. L36 TaxID=1747221 RepID=UPI001C20A9CF|nr:alpha/beta hydrolase [Rhodanobacter sp. L36]
MRARRFARNAIIGLLTAVTLLFAVVWAAGDMLIHPAPATIGAPPSDFPARVVVFDSASGARIHGWFAAGKGRGAILLLHGVRANRLSMLDRARFLHAAGYSVLLIDFQASGESSGDAITFGHLESRDAAAALTELKTLAPGEKTGIIGTSMGGAATLLAEPSLQVDAMVLEQVYPTLSQAVVDRMQLHAGAPGRWLAPLLLRTVKPHLGFDGDQMRPIDRVGQVHAPKLFVVGAADQHTPITESLAMFEQAASPKELWVVSGAQHLDLYRFAGGAYEARVLDFFNKWLRQPSRAME